MKVCVYGLWHLGTTTAACLAQAGFETIGLDPKEKTVSELWDGIPPLFEPGLAELVKSGLASHKLSFSTDVPDAVRAADIVWIAFDTPVDDEDRADVTFVKNRIAETFPYLRDGAVVLVSSQMPVGSIRDLEKRFARVAGARTVHFACSPENLRLGKAIEIFNNPGRIVIGVRNPAARATLEPLLLRFCDKLIWVSVESAETTKHALNAFLATCVTYINEIATICEAVGADASEVENAIRSDPRVGTKTYVTPGAAFAGGTLARDVRFLADIAQQNHLATPMIGGILPSNDQHRLWALHRLKQMLSPISGNTVALLGLSYKPGTDALRRSVAIELCRELVKAGARVQGFDPAVKTVPADLEVTLCKSAADAMGGASALVVATEWPEFRKIGAEEIAMRMKRPLVLDQSRFLASQLGADKRIEYVRVGSAS